MNDWELLQQYAGGDRAAMDALVRRHMGLVYSLAARLVRGGEADDVTQAVFLLLTRKAPDISRRQSLVGWLYHATRLCAANVRKQEGRRRRHEEAAMQRHAVQNQTETGPWVELLDKALCQLGDADRAAVLLHHQQGQTYEEGGAALGLSAEAVRKRAGRGLEQLRSFFAARGIHAGTLGSLAVALPEAKMQAVLAMVHGAAPAAHVRALAAGIRMPLTAKKASIGLGVAAAVALAAGLYVLFGPTAGGGNAHPPGNTAVAALPMPAGAGTAIAANAPATPVATQGDHPTEAEIKALLKARLERLSNLHITYAASTQYLPPPGGWPKPTMPAEGALNDFSALVAGPAILRDSVPLPGTTLDGRLAAATQTAVYPSGTVESDKALALLGGSARYERTIRKISRDAFFPDWLREFHAAMVLAHDNKVERLCFYEDGSLALASSDSAGGLLPEPDMELALAVAGFGPQTRLSRAVERTSRTFTASDIDAMSVQFPDANRVVLVRASAGDAMTRGGIRGTPASLPATTAAAPTRGQRLPSMSDDVREEWTLSRALGYAPIAYRRSQFEIIDMSMSDFRDIGGLQMPGKVVAKHVFPMAGADQMWRMDTLTTNECHVQDSANTAERMNAMSWPEGKTPVRPAWSNLPPVELQIGAENYYQLGFSLTNLRMQPDGSALNLDNDRSPSKPSPRRTPWWLSAHQSFVERAKKGGIDVLFLGDELIEDWRKDDANWKDFAALHAANFGLRVDRVEHLLWRLSNGELDGLMPRAIVLEIGSVDAAHVPAQGGAAIRPGLPSTLMMPMYGATAMRGGNEPVYSPDQIAAGVATVIQVIEKSCPGAKILLLGIPPQGADIAIADTQARRQRVEAVNQKLRALDGEAVLYFELPAGKQPDGSLAGSDYVNGYLPTSGTYAQWTDSVRPVMERMLRGK